MTLEEELKLLFLDIAPFLQGAQIKDINQYLNEGEVELAFALMVDDLDVSAAGIGSEVRAKIYYLNRKFPARMQIRRPL